MLQSMLLPTSFALCVFSVSLTAQQEKRSFPKSVFRVKIVIMMQQQVEARMENALMHH